MQPGALHGVKSGEASESTNSRKKWREGGDGVVRPCATYEWAAGLDDVAGHALQPTVFDQHANTTRSRQVARDLAQQAPASPHQQHWASRQPGSIQEERAGNRSHALGDSESCNRRRT